MNVGFGESVVSHGKSSELSGITGKQCLNYESVETVENVKNADTIGYNHVNMHPS